MKVHSLLRRSSRAATAITAHRIGNGQVSRSAWLGYHQFAPRSSTSAIRVSYRSSDGFNTRRFASTEATQREVEGQMEYASADDAADNATNGATNNPDSDTANWSSKELPQMDVNGVLRHFEGEEIPSPDDLLVLRKADKPNAARSADQAPALDRSMGQPISQALGTATGVSSENRDDESQASRPIYETRLPEGTVSSLEDVEHRLQEYVKFRPEGPLVRYRKVVEIAERVFIEYKVGIGKNFSIRLKFDRIKKANALHMKLMNDLTLVFQALAKIESLACVVLTSQNTPGPPSKMVFCGGADVHHMLSIDTPAEAETFIRTVSGLCTAIRDLPAPVIAEIDGPCIGAGLEVAAACDIRIASAEASFSMPEVKLGIPSVVEARLLCDIIGWGRARHLMLTGESWTAEEALQAGLVTKVFDGKKGLLGVSLVYMQDMAANPVTYKAQKTLMRVWENRSVEGGIEAGVKAFADVWRNKDTRNTTKSLMKKAREGSLPRGVDAQDQRKQSKKMDGVGNVSSKVDADENVVSRIAALAAESVVRRVANDVKEVSNEAEEGAVKLREREASTFQIRRQKTRDTPDRLRAAPKT